MRFPYGSSDFGKLICAGYVYRDRTDRIPLLEASGDQLLFIRPQRVGKSLLLSMLECYYDLGQAEQFAIKTSCCGPSRFRPTMPCPHGVRP